MAQLISTVLISGGVLLNIVLMTMSLSSVEEKVESFLFWCLFGLGVFLFLIGGLWRTPEYGLEKMASV